MEEIKRAIGRLGEGKASGIDRILEEVWKYGDEEIKRWVWEFCNRIWRWGKMAGRMEGGDHSADSKKRRRGKSRGVTLLPTLYKLYVSVLAERLNEEIEGKGIVPQNQTGFRRRMETLDNIYAINYAINT